MEALVLIAVFGGLWLWTRHDQARDRKVDEAFDQKIRSIREDLDQVIEEEIEKLPPEEQAYWRQKTGRKINSNTAKETETPLPSATSPSPNQKP